MAMDSTNFIIILFGLSFFILSTPQTLANWPPKSLSPSTGPITLPPIITKPPVTLPPLPPVITKPPITLPPIPPVTVPPVTIPPVVLPPVLPEPPAKKSPCPLPPAPKPKPKPKPCPSPASKCPVDTLKLGDCLEILGTTWQIGDPAVKCCPLIAGLVSVDAALCLCTAIKAKALGLEVFLPIAVELLVTCGKTPPPGYSCK